MNITGKARIILVDAGEGRNIHDQTSCNLLALIMPIAVTLRLSCLLVFDFLSLWYRGENPGLMHAH